MAEVIGKIMSADEVQRRQLGKENKLRRAEIYYYGPYPNRSQVLHVYQDNLTGKEIEEFCERIYKSGLLLPIDPGHWRIVSPADIIDVHIYKQDKFFEK